VKDGATLALKRGDVFCNPLHHFSLGSYSFPLMHRNLEVSGVRLPVILSRTIMLQSVRKTIRVFFANCPHLDELAAAYLVLAQNSVQTVLEFEVWHLSVYAADEGLGNAQTKCLEMWSESALPLPWKRAAARRYAAHMDGLAVPTLAGTLPLPNALTVFVHSSNATMIG